MRTTMSDLAEEDVPLRGRNPSELKVPELKRWLMCRGASVKEKGGFDCEVRIYTQASMY